VNGYRTILFPTDFSDVAATALEHAKRLATAFSSQLHVLHVLEDPADGIWLEESYVLPEDLLRRREEGIRKRLNEVLSAEERERFSACFALEKGSPFVEIVRYAREKEIDLVVMGTLGRGPVAHMLLGSVADKVARRSSCPVLLVRAAARTIGQP
jgi:nucleotide-binding universal stress UspA family protein